jgi:hypothetical protein
MPDRQPDPCTLCFAGDIDAQGRPMPMTVEVLRGRTEKWPVSEQTPARMVPPTVDGLTYTSSMVMLDSARRDAGPCVGAVASRPGHRGASGACTKRARSK